VTRLRGVPGIGVDRMGDQADALADPAVLRLENLDTDLRPPAAALVFSNEPADRLRGMGARVRRALQASA
jgi:hypothetical protein